MEPAGAVGGGETCDALVAWGGRGVRENRGWRIERGINIVSERNERLEREKACRSRHRGRNLHWEGGFEVRIKGGRVGGGEEGSRH